jgi:hypothetical protein
MRIPVVRLAALVLKAMLSKEMVMLLKRNMSIGIFAITLIVFSTPFDHVRAHGGDNWDPFMIDGVNDNARVEVLKVQALMADVIRGRIGAEDWPVAGLQEMRDSLLTAKEVVDEVLEHYLVEGVDVRSTAALHAEPRAGRSVAASRSLAAGISIIEYAATLADADTFITKFYLGDMPARLFELLEVNVDRMDLYAAMTANAEQLRVPDSLPE